MAGEYGSSVEPGEGGIYLGGISLSTLLGMAFDSLVYFAVA